MVMVSGEVMVLEAGDGGGGFVLDRVSQSYHPKCSFV
jgi:hypothetical protein